MEDYTVGDCPVCGGRLYVDTQYPDVIKCDTCEYEPFSLSHSVDLEHHDFADLNQPNKD